VSTCSASQYCECAGGPPLRCEPSEHDDLCAPTDAAGDPLDLGDLADAVTELVTALSDVAYALTDHLRALTIELWSPEPTA
jgi:hypothetical protein